MRSMKSDIEQLRDFCNRAIEGEHEIKPIAENEKHLWNVPDYAVYEIVLRLGEFIILKPKKDL